jgi:PKD repeat protein
MESPRPLSRPQRRTARDLAGRLGLRAALTALVLASLPVASAQGAGGSAVVVSGPGGTTFAIGEETLRAGSEGGTYTVRAHPGEPGEAFTRTGVSIRRLIVLAGADPEAVGYVIVPRPDGSSAYLPGADFAAEPPFEAGLPALVSVDSGCVRFLRPLTADPGDVNGEDNIASCGAPLRIEVRDGNLLTVGATASSTRVKVGTTVRFSGAAEGAKEGEGLTYEWSFGDGAGAAGQTPTHVFTAAGSYRVTVAAIGSAESGGESTPLTIVVGAPAAVGTGAGKDAAKQPKRGATLSEAKATPASPATGAGETGTGVAEPGESGRAGAEPEGSGAGADSGVGTLGPVVGPLRSRTAGRFDQGSDDRSDRAPGESAKGPRVESPRRAESGAAAESGAEAGAAARREGTEADASGRTVSGRLVADYVLPGAASSAGGGRAGGADSGSAAAPDGGSVSVPLSGLVAAALLLGGASIQWRRQSRGARR